MTSAASSRDPLNVADKMYDPLVVDAFVREHAALSVGSEFNDLRAVIRVHQQDSQSIVVGPDEPISFTESAQSLRLLAAVSAAPEGPPFVAVCRRLVDDLRCVAAFDTAVVYLIDDSTAEAEASFVSGTMALQLAKLRIKFAERLTGWVAAHKTAVRNSDATLDLDAVAVISGLALGSSMPLVVCDHTFGVLSLYGRANQEITPSQRRALESLLPTIAGVLGGAIHRPAAYIDCTEPIARKAAFAALDAILSHARHPQSEAAGVLYLSVTGPNTEHGAPHYEFLVSELLPKLSPRADRIAAYCDSAAMGCCCALDCK